MYDLLYALFSVLSYYPSMLCLFKAADMQMLVSMCRQAGLMFGLLVMVMSSPTPTKSAMKIPHPSSLSNPHIQLISAPPPSPQCTHAGYITNFVFQANETALPAAILRNSFNTIVWHAADNSTTLIGNFSCIVGDVTMVKGRPCLACLIKPEREEQYIQVICALDAEGRSWNKPGHAMDISLPVGYNQLSLFDVNGYPAILVTFSEQDSFFVRSANSQGTIWQQYVSLDQGGCVGSAKTIAGYPYSVAWDVNYGNGPTWFQSSDTTNGTSWNGRRIFLRIGAYTTNLKLAVTPLGRPVVIGVGNYPPGYPPLNVATTLPTDNGNFTNWYSYFQVNGTSKVLGMEGQPSILFNAKQTVLVVGTQYGGVVLFVADTVNLAPTTLFKTVWLHKEDYSGGKYPSCVMVDHRIVYCATIDLKKGCYQWLTFAL